jgi:hypothetical protein
MSDSTSILDLPTDPVGGGNISNNISIKAMDNMPLQSQSGSQSQGGGFSLDQSTISQIVSGLQQASISGATQLSSRDIPMTSTGHNIDPNIQPNYVPPPPQHNMDYIKDYEQTSDMVNNYNKNNQRQNSLDEMYNEIQTPLLLAVLYFLFQLPFFRKFLFGYFPVLFSNDGNLNINGFLFTSVLFGLLFYFLNKLTTHFGAF